MHEKDKILGQLYFPDWDEWTPEHQQTRINDLNVLVDAAITMVNQGLKANLSPLLRRVLEKDNLAWKIMNVPKSKKETTEASQAKNPASEISRDDILGQILAAKHGMDWAALDNIEKETLLKAHAQILNIISQIEAAEQMPSGTARQMIENSTATALQKAGLSWVEAMEARAIEIEVNNKMILQKKIAPFRSWVQKGSPPKDEQGLGGPQL